MLLPANNKWPTDGRATTAWVLHSQAMVVPVDRCGYWPSQSIVNQCLASTRGQGALGNNPEVRTIKILGHIKIYKSGPTTTTTVHSVRVL